GAHAVAHRVHIVHAEAAVRAVHLTGAFAETEVHLGEVASEGVMHALVPPTEIVRLRGPIFGGTGPCAIAQDFPLTEEAREADGQANASGLDRELTVFLGQFELWL